MVVSIFHSENSSRIIGGKTTPKIVSLSFGLFTNHHFDIKSTQTINHAIAISSTPNWQTHLFDDICQWSCGSTVCFWHISTDDVTILLDQQSIKDADQNIVIAIGTISRLQYHISINISTIAEIKHLLIVLVHKVQSVWKWKLGSHLNISLVPVFRYVRVRSLYFSNKSCNSSNEKKCLYCFKY